MVVCESSLFCCEQCFWMKVQGFCWSECIVILCNYTMLNSYAVFFMKECQYVVTLGLKLYIGLSFVMVLPSQCSVMSSYRQWYFQEAPKFRLIKSTVDQMTFFVSSFSALTMKIFVLTSLYPLSSKAFSTWPHFSLVSKLRLVEIFYVMHIDSFVTFRFASFFTLQTCMASTFCV